MNKFKNIWTLALGFLVLSGCNDDFLEEKQDLTGVNEEVFQDPHMAQAYVDYVYYLFSPSDNGRNLIWDLFGGFEFSKNTDEMPGRSALNQEYSQISFTEDHALEYFGERMGTSIRNNTWTRMKEINLFLSEIDQHGLPEELRNELKGQMYFWRAWQYFDLVKLYGGVPLVLEPQNPIIADADETQVPRSTTKECIEQIVADLDMAMELLPGRWSGDDWGRITSGAAAAFKSRVLVTWASPLFNRNEDASRWQMAYDASIEARSILEGNGFGLYKKGNLENGEAWGKMWFEEVDNPEAVMIYGFNDTSSDQIKKNNGWEKACRPRNLGGDGRMEPTIQLVNSFPMADGRPIDESPNYEYDLNHFYRNRDPRFYHTFAFNGAFWPYDEDGDYRHWSYRWYSAEGDETPNKTTETNGTNSSGIYMKKSTNPSASSSDNFAFSGTDIMEIRFAEVVLNIAESAVGIGNIQEGLNAIMEVRERAGVENLDGTYGLGSGLSKDQAFAKVIEERKVEFAFEGRRFWDLRRWLLMDDEFGYAQRLGFEPINGMRRMGIYVVVKDQAGNPYNGEVDPMIADADGNVPIIDRSPEEYPDGIETEEEYLDYLYDNYYEVQIKDDLDPTNNNWEFRWYPEYYFIGLNEDVLSSSPYLEQTVGWNSFSGDGTFDPLAE
ncbi:RagB/SusD family nutrient uptake outer membrane protein [Echinicola strongylocentroti]|uniref:RagB/SusD family nutrient uptake outer membrane protein n=1 Tax=Echinicola strongylocentroti TaxID=1795355 RepID=A0A2Z4IIT0_9BACT|nr:RagB/SusD family nutrient uptake outer membrane protein [Echinicola strongylocentroti]AWW30805.1 RagB/SusD family nutrient uptake outer membrane protein [Echinicola strongylocentroti]